MLQGLSAFSLVTEGKPNNLRLSRESSEDLEQWDLEASTALHVRNVCPSRDLHRPQELWETGSYFCYLSRNNSKMQRPYQV